MQLSIEHYDSCTSDLLIAEKQLCDAKLIIERKKAATGLISNAIGNIRRTILLLKIIKDGPIQGE